MRPRCLTYFKGFRFKPVFWTNYKPTQLSLAYWTFHSNISIVLFYYTIWWMATLMRVKLLQYFNCRVVYLFVVFNFKVEVFELLLVRMLRNRSPNIDILFSSQEPIWKAQVRFTNPSPSVIIVRSLSLSYFRHILWEFGANFEQTWYPGHTR